MTLNTYVRKVPSRDGVNYMSFNQDNGCFGVGTDGGFRIYNCDPFRETFRRNFPNGGIGIVEMLFRCNVLALVGGGPKPCWSPDRVQIWDDHTMQVIQPIKLSEPVKAVRLRRDKVFVATENVVQVYVFDTMELKHKYNTITNALGVFAVSPSSSRSVLICPALQPGIVRVEDHTDDTGGFLKVHESGVAMLTLNADGTLMATASERGTLIRVFDTVSQKQIREMRRGSAEALIYSLCFSPDAKLKDEGQATGFVACSSSNGTIHVFSLGDEEGDRPGNRKSTFALLGSVSSYFSSEWSFAWWTGPECPAVCVFGPADTIYVISSDGSFHKVLLDVAKGGEMVQKELKMFPMP
eukprot:Hpha_TRINITY_DN30210_c0_g1::TRINITY_DN30210_c0_g1_i1::g.27014::m.27014